LCVPEVFALFNRAMPNAHNLRKLQVCSTCIIRNIYTSDIRFPGHVSLPRELKFSLKDGADEAFGSWVNVPVGSAPAASTMSQMQISAIAPGGMNNSVMSGVPGNVMAGNNLANAGGVTTDVAGVGSPSYGSRSALNPVVNRLPVIPPPFANAGAPSLITEQPSMLAEIPQSSAIIPQPQPEPPTATLAQIEAAKQPAIVFPDPLFEVSHLLGV
jgi:hypothetical protein